jgi:hypothetical protein
VSLCKQGQLAWLQADDEGKTKGAIAISAPF